MGTDISKRRGTRDTVGSLPARQNSMAAGGSIPLFSSHSSRSSARANSRIHSAGLPHKGIIYPLLLRPPSAPAAAVCWLVDWLAGIQQTATGAAAEHPPSFPSPAGRVAASPLIYPLPAADLWTTAAAPGQQQSVVSAAHPSRFGSIHSVTDEWQISCGPFSSSHAYCLPFSDNDYDYILYDQSPPNYYQNTVSSCCLSNQLII
jgi:hypothetical protein